MKNKYLIHTDNIKKFSKSSGAILQDLLMSLLAQKTITVISHYGQPYKLVPKGMYFSAYKLEG